MPIEVDPAASLDSRLASLLDRLLGQVLDAAVMMGVAILGYLPRLFSLEVGENTLLGALVIIIAYFLLADGLAGGQSLGKRVVGTATVHADTGQPCSYWRSFVRNGLLWLLGPLDWIFIFGRRRQRLGDVVANTVVVKHQVEPLSLFGREGMS